MKKGVKGVSGFLGRAFRFVSNPENISEGEEDTEILKGLHQTIKKVEWDIEICILNTAISAMMIFLNLATKKGKIQLKQLACSPGYCAIRTTSLRRIVADSR